MRIIVALFVVITLGSCAQLSRLDTARTIGKGTVEVGAQIAGYGVDESTSPALGAVIIPFVGLNVNYGIKEKIDLMISVNSAGNFYFNPKFQIYGDQNSSLAIALLPGVDMQLGSIESMSDQSVFFRPHFSTIISIHENEWALFLEPKYVYQSYENTHFVGTTIGVDYTLERTSFALGYSYFPIIGENTASGSNLYQIGFSARMRLGSR